MHRNLCCRKVKELAYKEVNTMKIEEMTSRMYHLNTEIRSMLADSGYERDNDFYPEEYQAHRKTITGEDGSAEDVANLSPDEWQLVQEYERILSRLDDIADRLDYLAKPITHTGTAQRTENDRFTVDGCEFHRGCRCEYQRYDEEHDCFYWAADRIEYSPEHGGFYFYGSGEALREGMNVRIRW